MLSVAILFSLAVLAISYPYGQSYNYNQYPQRGYQNDQNDYMTSYYGTPQYYGYPSSASYQMGPYYQNQQYMQQQQQQQYSSPSQYPSSASYQMGPYYQNQQQQQYSSPSQSSWTPVYYGQQSQNPWSQTQSNWGRSPYQFTNVNAQVVPSDDNDEGSGSGIDSAEQTTDIFDTMTSNDN